MIIKQLVQLTATIDVEWLERWEFFGAHCSRIGSTGQQKQKQQKQQKNYVQIDILPPHKQAHDCCMAIIIHQTRNCPQPSKPFSVSQSTILSILLALLLNESHFCIKCLVRNGIVVIVVRRLSALPRGAAATTPSLPLHSTIHHRFILTSVLH